MSLFSVPKNPVDRAYKLSVYGERMETPLVITALLFIVAYSWQVIGTPTGIELVLSEVLMWATWAIFSIDFIITMALTEHKDRFTPMNVLHLLAVALPAFRLFRLVRLISILKVVNRSAVTIMRDRLMGYVVISVALVVYVGALAALDAERFAPDAKITNLGDAIWWAFVTITTVGYGDYFPVTAEGRVVAAVLMVAGISLLGLVTATMGVWVLSILQEIKKQELNDEKKDALARKLGIIELTREELTARLKELDESEAELKREQESRDHTEVMKVQKEKSGREKEEHVQEAFFGDDSHPVQDNDGDKVNA